MAIAVVAGTTGLLGNLLLELLVNDDHYSRIITLTRKPLDRHHAKLESLVFDFDRLGDYATQLKADDVFCCLGTTIRQAGSQAAFRKVDFDYPLNLARVTKAQGANQFLLVTALGSDKGSSIFYNRVKGEVEEAISHVGFTHYHIFQPSMLLGDRKESRAGEGVGKVVMTALDFLIPKKYKAIDAAKVARSMVAVARKNQAGNHIHVSGELQDY